MNCDRGSRSQSAGIGGQLLRNMRADTKITNLLALLPKIYSKEQIAAVN
jgi:hypothetical protein